MIDGAEDLALLDEPGHHVGIGAEIVAQHFHGDELVGVAHDRAVHSAHPATPEDIAQQVAASERGEISHGRGLPGRPRRSDPPEALPR